MAWKCEVCGYIHVGNEPPETCPVCGVGKEMFVPFEVPSSAPDAQPPSGEWQCTVCGYVHQGDAPPDQCPVCKAGPEAFEALLVAAKDPQGAASAVRVVIIGGGIAAITAAEHARLRAPSASVTLVSREPVFPYYRLNLTRFLAGEVAENELALRPETWFAEQNIRLVQDEAVSLDTQRHEVTLAHRGVLPYDTLVLATGAHPFVPPIPGSEHGGMYTLRTLGDAKNIRQRAKPGAPVVCIGGGLLGLEAAGALARLGMQPTVVEGFGWLLPRQLPEAAGRMLERHLATKGISVRVGVTAQSIVGATSVREVRLTNGEVLPAALVVISAGVRPTTVLARKAGLTVNMGVVVDDRLATSERDIYAAGDVAEHRGVVYGIWPAAYAQGAVAGINAVGGSETFRGIPRSNRLKVLDVDMFSIGEVNPTDGSYRILERSGSDHHIRLVTRDGRVVGASLYGDTSLANVVKECAENGAQVHTVEALVKTFPELR